MIAVRDTVLIRLSYNPKIGSVYIPDEAKQYFGEYTGEVVAVGEEFPYELSVGDKIYLPRHEGFKVYATKEYLSLQEKWVVAKVGDYPIPIGDRVTIEPFPPKEKIGSVYLPDEEKETQEGKVIAVGKEVKGFAVNDIVIFGELYATDITINDKKYIVYREKDILGRVE